MIHEVKIFKPDKDGKLIEVNRIPGEEVSRIHWTNFGSDPHRTKISSDIQYHRIGVTKQCVECNIEVEDARRKTCSIACQTKRLNRQRFESKHRKRTKRS